MNGFINVNKPSGMTSFDVIRELRRRLQIKKMGHLGTLDPEATGVLPVAVGNATRLIAYLEDGIKSYRSRGRLGAISDTQDKTGKITIIEPHCKVSREQIEQVLISMTGEIMQRPPMYSAVHYKGQRLYDLARQGIEVEVAARPVTIHKLELMALDKDDNGWWAELNIDCSRGTYIRTIWHDLGQDLGCGAYMERLERTRAGCFQIENAIPLELCSAEHILPLDYPFQFWPELIVDGKVLERIKNGNQVTLSEVEAASGPLVIKNNEGELIALAELVSAADRALIKPLRVMASSGKG